MLRSSWREFWSLLLLRWRGGARVDEAPDEQTLVPSHVRWLPLRIEGSPRFPQIRKKAPNGLSVSLTPWADGSLAVPFESAGGAWWLLRHRSAMENRTTRFRRMQAQCPHAMGLARACRPSLDTRQHRLQMEKLQSKPEAKLRDPGDQ
ncbi:hypothetical protein B0J13DRAFT_1290 [Dactylonectria estremocensis]|uniref:Secreted protein n=1 Tax=Dactylonectria estremocensis TaxID=1079267 RepID=A0A9P9FJI3_9HYPO|nr:hypothetical protein B0J13DRAFT_1290 [Dactylonectria estremocensis]